MAFNFRRHLGSAIGFASALLGEVGNRFRRYFTTLDGTADYYTIPTVTLTGDFEIEANFSTTQIDGTIIGNSSNTDNIVRIDSDTLLRLRIGDNSIKSFTTTGLIDGKNNHILIKRVGSTVEIFHNGVSIGTATDSDTFTLDVIGQYNSSTYFDGVISDVKITDGTDLIRYYKIDENFALTDVLTDSVDRTPAVTTRNFTTLSSASSQYYSIPEVNLTTDFEIELDFSATTFNFALLGGLGSSFNFISLKTNTTITTRIGDGTINTWTSGVSLADGKLHNLKMIRISGNVEFFIDGVSIGINTDSDTFTISGLGAYNTPVDFFNGVIANVKITDNGTLIRDYKIDETWDDNLVLVNDEATLGSDLITNGDFEDGSTDWVESAGSVTFSDDVCKFDSGIAETTHISQNITLGDFPTGTILQVEFNIPYADGTANIGFYTISDGYKYFDVVSGSTIKGLIVTDGSYDSLVIRRSSSNVSDVWIDNVTVKQADGYGEAISITSADSETFNYVDDNWVGEMEIVTNGGFADGTDWILSGAAAISGGVCNFSVNGDGVRQNNIIPDGKYIGTFDVVRTSGTLISCYNGTSDGLNVVATGSYTNIFNGDTSADLWFFSSSFVGTLDNVSVKRILQIPTTNGVAISISESELFCREGADWLGAELVTGTWTVSGAEVVALDSQNLQFRGTDTSFIWGSLPVNTLNGLVYKSISNLSNYTSGGYVVQTLLATGVLIVNNQPTSQEVIFTQTANTTSLQVNRQPSTILDSDIYSSLKRILQAPPTAQEILTDGSTVLWVDSQENITKDGSNLVSLWGDKSGNGNDLIQAVETNRPTWSSNGVLFDGVDNFMKAAAFTLNQPEFIYIVFKQITHTNVDKIFDGNLGSRGFLTQSSPTPELKVYGGVLSASDGNLALDTYGIARVQFNGVSSTFQINEFTQITGDFGAIDMGGFSLGARPDGVSPSNIEVKEVIIRNVADSTQDEGTIYNYLSAKYSI